MADKKQTTHTGPSAKLRVVLAASSLVAIVGVAGFMWHHHHQVTASAGSAEVAGTPNIQSLPGAGKPSNQYVKDQNLQNKQKAIAARKDASSAVPTIVRPNFIGNPNSFGELPKQTTAKSTTPKTCPIAKTVVMYKPNPASCTVPNLKLAHNAGVTAEELRCQGCSCAALKLSGYTAGELKGTGYTATELRHCGYSLKQLLAAGFNANDLRDAGFSAKQLRDAGFTPGQLAAAGFSADQISKAGYTPEALAAAGLKASANTKVCSVSHLMKARAAGVSAATLRKQGCGLAALKAAGYTAKQLKAAGFSADALKQAGFSDAALKAAGFTAAQIRHANAVAKSCSVAELKKERAAGVSALALRQRGCGLAALKAAGFTAGELKAAGFTAKQLKDAGFSAADLKAAGFSAKALKDAGFSAKQLKDAGYSASALKGAGFSAAALKKAGFSAAALKNAGFSADDLKAAGFGAQALKDAGFSAEQLKDAGYSAGQLNAAGYSAAALKAAGFTPTELRAAGFSADALKAAGFDADALKLAGYTKGDLLRAGFTPKASGYKTEQVAAKPAVAASAPAQTTNNRFPSISASTPEGKLAKLERMQQQEMSQQQRQDAEQQMQTSMAMQAQKMLEGWSGTSKQVMMAAIPQKVSAVAGGKGGKSAGAFGPVAPTLKAGTIMFAVLDTSINSDEQSPVLAHIVTGPLKGTKLLGKFTRENQRLLIQFDLLSVPSYPKSLSVSAVAIDPDTARSAISGQVNNHYLLRYGSLFASAFLEGLGGAIQSSGSSISLGSGVAVVNHPKLTTQQQMLVGLGTVGQQMGQSMSDIINKPPTVKVQGGSGIGILFMKDVTLPTQLAGLMKKS